MLKIIYRLQKLGIKTTMVYRSTTIIMIFVSSIFFLLEVITGFIYYSYTNNIAGFSKLEYFNLITTQAIITSMFYAIFHSGITKVQDDLIDGKLDYLFLKPVNQFIYMIFDGGIIDQYITLFMYLIFQIYLFSLQSISIINLIIYFILVLIGLWYMVIFNIFLTAIVFYVDKATALFAISESVESTFSKPIGIYPKSIQYIFSYIFSFLLVYNLPIQVLKGTYDYKNISIYILIVILSTILVYKFLKKAIRNYQSVS